MDQSRWNDPHLPGWDPNSSLLERRKRRKVALACGECRARKVRCDGKRPACEPCLDRAEHHGVEVNCEYSKASHGGRPPQPHSQGLNRASILGGSHPPQQETSQHLTRFSYGESQIPTGRPLGGNLVENSRYRPKPNLPYNAYDSPASRSRVQGHTPNNRRKRGDIADGANAMVGEVESDERQPTSGFFGSSSAANFMRQIRVTVNKQVPASESTNMGPLLFPHPREKETCSPSLMSTQILPPRRMANQLMEIYWNVVFPLYPFFNREELSAEYRKLWNGEESLTCDEDTLMCTFNVIFALGCQLADFIKPEDRADMAGNFFARAQELLPGNMWHSGPSSVIQCLLLVSQYLQSTDSADQCWMVTGMAIRSAQGLGLHLPETSLHLENSHEQELVRKIWHGCVLMDRVVALTLGRPAMISKEAAKAVPLPVVVDEHRLQVPLEQTEESLFLKFYTKSLELYEILNDILLSLYKSPTPPSKPENSHNSYFNSFDDGQVAVFRLDHALSTWSLDLPPHLRTSSPLSSRDPISDRQSIVLRLRFLHVRMVLLRPILSKYCDLFTRERLIVSDDSLPQRFAVQCSILCVRSAQDLVDMVYNNFPPNGQIGKLPSWWYNILYVYTAATILIAGRLCPAILAEATEESVSLSWQRALNILRNYQSYSSSARRCVLALELLYEQINPSAAAVVSQRSPTFPHPVMNDVSLGEGVSAAVIDGFDLPDFVDMSWLNSVPSNLY